MFGNEATPQQVITRINVKFDPSKGRQYAILSAWKEASLILLKDSSDFGIFTNIAKFDIFSYLG